MPNFLAALGQSQAISNLTQGLANMKQQELQARQGEQAIKSNDLAMQNTTQNMAIEKYKYEQQVAQDARNNKLINVQSYFDRYGPEAQKAGMSLFGHYFQMQDGVPYMRAGDQQQLLNDMKNPEANVILDSAHKQDLQNKIKGFDEQMAQLNQPDEAGKIAPPDKKITETMNYWATEKAKTQKELDDVVNNLSVFGTRLDANKQEARRIELSKDFTPESVDAYIKSDGATSLIKIPKEPVIKEVNLPPVIDAFLTQKFGSKYTSSDTSQRKQFIDYMSTEQGKKEFKKFAPEYISMTATPYYQVVPTSEGLTQFNSRKEGGTPVATGLDKPLSSEMITAEQQFGTLKDGLSVVKRLYKPEFVGPAAGRIGTAEESTIGLPENQATFYSALEGMKNALIYALSGKQIHESEYNRLLKQMPTRNLPESVFEARMKEFDRQLQSIIDNRHKAMGGYGLPQNNSRQMINDKLKQKYNLE